MNVEEREEYYPEDSLDVLSVIEERKSEYASS